MKAKSFLRVISAVVLIAGIVAAAAWNSLQPPPSPVVVKIPTDVIVVRATPDPSSLLKFGSFDSQSRFREPKALEVSQPLGCYRLDLDIGEMPTAAEPTLFYYALSAYGKPYQSLWFEVNHKGTGPVLGPEFGNRTRWLAETMERVANLAQLKGGQYEPRLLEYMYPNGLPAQVVWLKALSGGPDLIYTAPYAAYNLKRNTLYAADEFLKIVVPAMRDALEENRRRNAAR